MYRSQVYMLVQFIAVFLTSGFSCTTLETPCPEECSCSFSEKMANCSDHGKKLSYIPPIPLYVQSIRLNNDYFPKINRTLFRPLKSHTITSLEFKLSQLRSIDEYSFADLDTLGTMDFGSNVKLNISDLKLSLMYLPTSRLVHLSFEYMRWNESHLAHGLFSNIKGRVLQTLNLGFNNIGRLASDSLRGLGNLSRLNLSWNRLTSCDKVLRELPSLVKLDLTSNALTECSGEHLPHSLEILMMRNNSFTKFPNLCENNGSIIERKFKDLRLQENQINSLHRDFFLCMPYLQVLKLRKNLIVLFPSNVFSMMKMLISLDLGDMRSDVQTIEKNAFSIPSLKVFKFDHNNFKFNRYRYSTHPFFSNCDSLQQLDLSKNRISLKIGDPEQLFRDLHNVEILRLRDVTWHKVPDNFFKIFKSLKKISLEENEITSIHHSLFSDTCAIEELNLSNNRISVITKDSFPLTLLHSLRVIDLSANPFTCDCNLLWFRDWIRSLNITVKNYPKVYKCATPPSRKGLKFHQFNLTAEECRFKSQLIIVIVGASSVCLFAIIVSVTIYKTRWHIRYWIYLMKYKRSKYKRIRNDETFKYDAFVIYCEEDNDWVIQTFIEKLEKGEGLQLCIHQRDFDIGKVIVENIVDCMSDSRFAVVVLSNDFCKSQWCNFELLLAQDRWLSDQSDPLLLVMLEEVSSKHMTGVLRALITTTTYTVWSDDEQGKQLFWSQIVSALKK